MTTIPLTSEDEAPVEEFAGSIFTATLAAMELANVELGLRLGLYDALVTHGGQTSAGLAKATGTIERYVREWLEQQAVAGVLVVDDPGEPGRAGAAADISAGAPARSMSPGRRNR